MTADALTAGQVAKALGCQPSAVKKWANQGLLSCWRLPHGDRRFARDEVLRFMRELGVPLERLEVEK